MYTFNVIHTPHQLIARPSNLSDKKVTKFETQIEISFFKKKIMVTALIELMTTIKQKYKHYLRLKENHTHTNQSSKIMQNN